MSSIKAIRTNSSNPDFQELVKELDKELKIQNGEEHEFYHQFNKIDGLNHAIVVYENDIAIGCGAVKEFSKEAMEIKRMFVPFSKRGKGVASVVLSDLEKWVKELGYKKCILETGKKQPGAIALYKKNGYTIISNFGQYVGVENSLCFEKQL